MGLVAISRLLDLTEAPKGSGRAAFQGLSDEVASDGGAQLSRLTSRDRLPYRVLRGSSRPGRGPCRALRSAGSWRAALRI